jgi:anaerobic magnesium-protoporphyrin IX monomethyl ester cyclase
MITTERATDGAPRANARDGVAHRRVVFLIAPTGAYCREDRCQSYFSPDLIPSMRPPMEECEAAGAIRAAGAEPFVIDAPALGLDATATLAKLKAIAPDLVVLVATFGTLDEDLAWASPVRAVLPGVAIGVRGAPCYALAEDILARAADVDFCVRGEYELIFDAVVRRGWRDAVGTVFREAGGIAASPPSGLTADLDALPRPDRSVVEGSRYRVRGLGFPQATVRVQRGCPFPCTYCLVHSVSGDRARHRSPAGIADEMASVMRDGTRFFYLRAETFTLDRRWAAATCDAIAARCPGARWVTTTRVECVDDLVLAAMRRAGCYGISFGIDAASREIGERVCKKPDLARATAAMRACDAHGIVTLGYAMIGFLWDTPATIDETEAFLASARPDLLTIHFAHPYPGTRYWDDVAAAEARVASPRAQAEPALGEAALSPSFLQRRAREITSRHYRRPAVLASLARKGAGLVLPLWRKAPAPAPSVCPRPAARESGSVF